MSTRAGAPTGYTIEITQDQMNSPDGIEAADLRNVEIKLPEDVVVNPAVAAGLEACTEQQAAVGVEREARCPDASKIGQVTIDTPMLKEPLQGGLYQAEQFKNPFNSLLALYMVVKSERYGVEIKLPGKVSTDPVTGQITSRFEDNPQFPFDKVTVTLKGGSRAVLMNPDTCGVKSTEWAATSWAQPESPVKGVDSFEITEGVNGKPCITDQSQRGFDPQMRAGTANPDAGRSTAFNLIVSRPEGDQEIKSIRRIRLPEGVLGDISSVELCDAASADLGNCDETSRVGHVQASLGAGATPLWMPQAGKQPTAVYLSGPYKGAPYSLSVVVPAQAGPIDLGRVVVRSALHVDDQTAQITSGVDETRLIGRDGAVSEVLPEALPRILEGIELNQREIRVIIDREGFMINPTNCSESQVRAQIIGYGGALADRSSPFAAVDCARLGFAPTFRARILNKGRRSTLRSFHPRTRFTVVPRKGDANIGAARVVLPSSTILDQGNIGTTCTRAQMAERNCPTESIVGYARAWSPLLRRAVKGPVYLAANGGVRPLPDIAAVLDGEIRIVLRGEVSTLRTRGKARLQNTFRVVPDAPVTRFVLTMRGGKNTGLLVNSTDLCRSRERGAAVFRGQNGRRNRMALRLTPSFKGCRKVTKRSARR